MDNLEFRRVAAISVLQKYGKMPLATDPKSTFLSPASRREGQHLIITGQQSLRCAVCKNKSTKSCSKYRVALHDKCFFHYHNQ